MLLFGNSCHSDNSIISKNDSLSKIDSSIISIETDSGRLEIIHRKKTNEADFFLFSKNGKILQQGNYLENEVSGPWIKFDENGNAISAYHFSKGKAIHKLDSSDFNFVVYSSKNLGASFSYPKNWKEEFSNETSGIIAFSKTLKDKSPTTLAHFSIRHEQLQKGDNLEKLGQMQIQNLHENADRVELVNEIFYEQDSCQVLRRFGMYSDDSGTIGFLYAILLNRDNVWFLTCESPNNVAGQFLNYQGVFQEVLESFKSLKK